MKQDFLDLDGARIAYYSWGLPTNPPVVLMHGGGLNGATWRKVAAELEDDWYCLAPDLRGHGHSDWEADGDYTLAGYAADLAAMLARWGVTSPHLVGHSLGGQSALHAACHGLDLSSLTLVDVGPRLNRATDAAQINEFLDTDEFATLDEAVDKAVVFRPDRTRESLVLSLRRTLRETATGSWTWRSDPRRRASRLDRAGQAEQLVSRLGRIGGPVLVARGARSDLLTEEMAAEFVHLLRGADVPARLVTVPGAGHNVHSDRPVELAGHLDDFFHTSTGGRRRAEPNTTR